MLSPIARLATLLSLFCLLAPAAAYQVLISSDDTTRQVCSGMYGHGAEDAFIEGENPRPRLAGSSAGADPPTV